MALQNPFNSKEHAVHEPMLQQRFFRILRTRGIESAGGRQTGGNEPLIECYQPDEGVFHLLLFQGQPRPSEEQPELPFSLLKGKIIRVENEDHIVSGFQPVLHIPIDFPADPLLPIPSDGASDALGCRYTDSVPGQFIRGVDHLQPRATQFLGRSKDPTKIVFLS